MTRLAAICKKQGLLATVTEGKVVLKEIERNDSKKRERPSKSL